MLKPLSRVGVGTSPPFQCEEVLATTSSRVHVHASGVAPPLTASSDLPRMHGTLQWMSGVLPALPTSGAGSSCILAILTAS
jgi:hypothetical protein